MNKFLLFSLFTSLVTITLDTSCMLKQLVQQSNKPRLIRLPRDRNFNVRYLRTIGTKAHLLQRNKTLEETIHFQQEKIDMLTTRISMLETILEKIKSENRLRQLGYENLPRIESELYSLPEPDVYNTPTSSYGNR